MATHVAGGRPLTRSRAAVALAAALVADGLSIVLGPFGFTFADEIIDVGMMIVASATLGFHWLFLPTFVLELVPMVDALPTWTACVIAVTAIRRQGR